MGKGKIIVAIILLLLAIGGVLGYKFYGDKILEVIKVSNQDVVEENKPETPKEPEKKEKKEVKIFRGNDRPIAVMIDNHDEARPQVAINKAYVVYEIIVEGGYTRLMPIFKGVDIDEIGPIRSARHYFLDYALEHDAIYVHFGQSPQAESDIKKLKVDNVSGIIQKTTDFWRVKGKYAPHNVLSSTDKIKTIAEAMGHSLTSNKKSVLKYNVDEFNLKDGQDALEVYIPFSNSQDVKFEYNKETKRYLKYANGKKQSDWRTKEDTTFKNIIITFAQNYDLNDGSGKGRQGLTNVKTLDGYYITNGKVIRIKCEKNSRDSQTIYKDLDGKEIEVNDGNTYIGICPMDSEVTFKAESEDSQDN